MNNSPRQLKFPNKCASENDAGVITIFTALTTVGVLAVVALVIGAMLLNIAENKVQDAVAHGTKGAMHAYLQNGNLPESVRKRIMARDRGLAIMKDQYSIAGIAAAGSLTLTSTFVGGDPRNAPPVLVWGHWSKSPTKCDPNPAPCFIQQDALDINKPIGAMKIMGGFPPIELSPFHSLLSPTTSSDMIYSSATVAIVPRHGCFMIDVSNSSIRDTHVYRSAESIQDDIDATGSSANVGGALAFILTDDNSAAGVSSTWHDPAYPITGGGLYNPLSQPPYDVRPNGTVETPTVHYGSDYTPLRTYGDNDRSSIVDVDELHPPALEYPMGPTGFVYRADTYRDPDTVPDGPNKYVGPEPLNTIMTGLKYAVEDFRGRRVEGDKLCMVFYDHQLMWSRIFLPTDDFDYLIKATDFTLTNGTAPLPETLASDMSVEVEGYHRAIRYGLFPGIQRSSGFANPLRPLSDTDTPFAFEIVMQLLEDAKDEGVDSSDFIVMIGDGLTNCHNAGSTGNRICSDTYNSHMTSRQELQDKIVNRVIVDTDTTSTIPIHVIAVGAAIGPHELAVLNPNTNQCMTADEYNGLTRTNPTLLADLGLSIGFVAGGTDDMTGNIVPYSAVGTTEEDVYKNKSATNPFYDANRYLWEIATATRGIWAPLRPSPVGCTPRDEAADCTSVRKRQTVDPQCRTYEEQIIDYMSQVINDNPFVVVDRE